MRQYRIALFGVLWGLVAPLIGLYLGLTVNVMIATILTLPLIAFGALMDQGMLELPTTMIAAAFFISGALWSGIFVAVAAVLARLLGSIDPSNP